MTAPLLSFHAVSFGYQPSRQVLKDVTFNLPPAHIGAVLGPNGAGKTTLLSLALGWLRAQAGEILLGGAVLRELPASERGRSVALVPQSEYIPFDYTVLEYVLLGRAPHLPPLGVPGGADAAIAQGVLKQMGIADLAGRPVPQLSSGERQLVLLARALAQITPTAERAQGSASRLLLLDEPTAHLDLHNKARLIEIVRGLRASGVTMLMTSHDPEVVLAVADEVVMMEAGVPPDCGALDEALTAEALSRIYRMPIRLATVDGQRHVLWT